MKPQPFDLAIMPAFIFAGKLSELNKSIVAKEATIQEDLSFTAVGLMVDQIKSAQSVKSPEDLKAFLAVQEGISKELSDNAVKQVEEAAHRTAAYFDQVKELFDSANLFGLATFDSGKSTKN